MGGEIGGDGGRGNGDTEGGGGIYAAGWELSGGAVGIHDRRCAGIADAGGEGAGEEDAAGVGTGGGDGWRGTGMGERRGRESGEWSLWGELGICDLHVGIDWKAERSGSQSWRVKELSGVEQGGVLGWRRGEEPGAYAAEFRSNGDESA